MEQVLQNNNEENNSSNLIISNESVVYLAETVKWTKFLSIMGFILIGVMVIFSLFAGTMFSNFNNQNTPPGFGIGITLMYLLLALLYYFPISYLLKFSQNTKSALETNNNEDLAFALRNQKSLYKFMGISTIVMLSIYLILGLFMLVFTIFFKL